MEEEEFIELRIEARQFLASAVWHRLFKPAVHARIAEIQHLIATNKRITVDQLRDYQGQITILGELAENPQVLFGLDEE